MATTPKKGPGTRKVPTDMSLLTADDKLALAKEAKKAVLEEMTQDARDAYFQAELAKLRRARTPAEQMVSVMLDLASFVPYVAIDGVQYFHGGRYDVPRSTAIVLYEQMQRSWMHQDEIDGRSRFDPYRRPQNLTLGPRHIGQPTAGSNGVVTLPEDMEV